MNYLFTKKISKEITFQKVFRKQRIDYFRENRNNCVLFFFQAAKRQSPKIEEIFDDVTEPNTKDASAAVEETEKNTSNVRKKRLHLHF